MANYYRPILCTACHRRVAWPFWARVEHLMYYPFCGVCWPALDGLLTPESAIYEARCIVRNARSAVAR